MMESFVLKVSEIKWKESDSNVFPHSFRQDNGSRNRLGIRRHFNKVFLVLTGEQNGLKSFSAHHFLRDLLLFIVVQISFLGMMFFC